MAGWWFSSIQTRPYSVNILLFVEKKFWLRIISLWIWFLGGAIYNLNIVANLCLDMLLFKNYLYDLEIKWEPKKHKDHCAENKIRLRNYKSIKSLNNSTP